VSATGTTLGAEHARPPRELSPRLRRLAEVLDRSGARHGPEPRALLLVGGAVAIAFGVVAILLGWYGAAHSPYLFQEIPYVISGGLLGLALVVAGVGLVVGSWIVRLVEETRRAAGRLEQIVDSLARAADARLPVGTGAPDPRSGSDG
jgi:hypothetical protein